VEKREILKILPFASAFTRTLPRLKWTMKNHWYYQWFNSNRVYVFVKAIEAAAATQCYKSDTPGKAGGLIL
jgi:hypothetical protein